VKTVLLACDPQSYVVSVHRCRLRDRVGARLFALRLDCALAAGVSPDSSVVLSLRAHELLTAANRRSLARGLRRITKDAERPQHPGPVVPLARREILRHRDLIHRVADVVERAGPIDLCGLAAIEVMVRDGAGPMYGSDRVGALGPRLEAALEILSAPPAGFAVP
jgi:hypothetical protein